MKTILYQPLFINPQAYFVFPQLYHIEKGDSYIEPANITGQLIINDLTQSLTSTPILNVVQDTNQVDFGLFKGKHIRISQYTNIGAVALGEWYIPGTPTPPEPEQPDWFKESIVAWYSPYCKQRMTNFDVIEAYTEDFTKWAYRNYRGTAKITNNTIVITNVVEVNNIVEDDKEPYSDLTIRVTGVTENKYLIVRQGRGKPETHIKKDGVYTFKDNNLYFGFGVSVIGECNITITQLPTSILKDFSGNGNHAYLYGGKGKLNSGMGVYKFDFLSDLRINSAYISYLDRQEDKICSLIGHPADWLFQFISLSDIPAFKVEVKGIVNDRFVYRYYDENGNRGKEIIINKDGIYKLPISYSVKNNVGVGIVCSNACVDNVCFTQIPDYPDQLCYDGKMYAIAYGMPILTDYTVIADRTWFAEKVDNGVFMSKALEQNGAFILEYKQGDKWNTYSYYSATNINIDKDNSIVYQTKNKYNEQTIYPGDKQDTDTLFIGTIRKDDSRSFIGCHGDILLFNRTLTDDELSVIKEVVFGISDIKDALLTVDKKYIKLNDNNYIKLNK